MKMKLPDSVKAFLAKTKHDADDGPQTLGDLITATVNANSLSEEEHAEMFGHLAEGLGGALYDLLVTDDECVEVLDRARANIQTPYGVFRVQHHPSGYWGIENHLGDTRWCSMNRLGHTLIELCAERALKRRKERK